MARYYVVRGAPPIAVQNGPIDLFVRPKLLGDTTDRLEARLQEDATVGNEFRRLRVTYKKEIKGDIETSSGETLRKVYVIDFFYIYRYLDDKPSRPPFHLFSGLASRADVRRYVSGISNVLERIDGAGFDLWTPRSSELRAVIDDNGIPGWSSGGAGVRNIAQDGQPSASIFGDIGVVNAPIYGMATTQGLTGRVRVHIVTMGEFTRAVEFYPDGGILIRYRLPELDMLRLVDMAWRTAEQYGDWKAID